MLRQVARISWVMTAVHSNTETCLLIQHRRSASHIRPISPSMFVRQTCITKTALIRKARLARNSRILMAVGLRIMAIMSRNLNRIIPTTLPISSPVTSMVPVVRTLPSRPAIQKTRPVLRFAISGRTSAQKDVMIGGKV